MKSVALYDAKNRLSALIDEVERSGDPITITRHGRAVARLAPASAPLADKERLALAKAMLARRDARHEPDDSKDWKQLIGRRY